MRPPISRPALLLLLTAATACAGEPPPPVAPPVFIAPSAPLAPIGAAAASAPEPPPPPIAPSAPAAPAASASEPPQPAAAPAASSTTGRMLGPIAKIPPEAMKQYRVDVCYHGTFSLRQGREDYLAKLGGQRPGPGRVPVFVDLSPTGGGVAFERDARACRAAVALHAPDFGDVDTAIAAFEPLAMQVSKDLTAARAYYENGGHAADGFVQGEAFHDALIAGFAQLDALHDRLGAAIAARRKSQPPRVSEEGERLGRAAVEDAREVLLRGVAPKFDGRAFDAAVGRLGKSSDALRALEASNPSNVWAKILSGSLAVLRTLVEAPRPGGARRLESQTVHQLVRNFVGLIEARQRAISRVAMTASSSVTP